MAAASHGGTGVGAPTSPHCNVAVATARGPAMTGRAKNSAASAPACPWVLYAASLAGAGGRPADLDAAAARARGRFGPAANTNAVRVSAKEAANMAVGVRGRASEVRGRAALRRGPRPPPRPREATLTVR